MEVQVLSSAFPAASTRPLVVSKERSIEALRYGGHDGPDGRSLRYLEWVTDPDADDSTYETDYVLVLREPGKPLRIEHDHHVEGLFADATWRRLLEEEGLEVVDPGVEDPFAGEHAVFIGRRRSS